MRFAYLLPTTLIDFPGLVAALVYTPGCNLRCPFCHNSELVLPERIKALDLIEEEEVLSLLDERKGFLDGLCITGGEPTLHEGLAGFIERVKKLGLAVKLDTNGTRPERLKELLDSRLLDYVAMDVKGPPGRYSILTGVKIDFEKIEASIRIILTQAPDYEFRTTVVPTLGLEDIKKVASLIAGAKRYYLQRFVVPAGKGLVDPTWNDRVAPSAEDLQAMWEKIKLGFPEGGAR
ncbi:MAG: anaerobic ribonucleoside-triphosphate reductase activating protein [Candidatus Bipolaricaulota bacterium]|nr:anaerobic ribonucleoside-triphosphate reductase activating protein [Candidatus Bipolaricaulota bacterium]